MARHASRDEEFVSPNKCCLLAINSINMSVTCKIKCEIDFARSCRPLIL